MDLKLVHLKKLCLFAIIPTNLVHAHVAKNNVHDRHEKYLQFATLFHLLQQSKRLTDYEQMYHLFEIMLGAFTPPYIS